MRPIAPLAALLALSMIVPLAAAEGWQAKAGGLTLGMRSGVTGVQFGEENGVGVRYWSNDTAAGGRETTIFLTTCYASGSGLVAYCERHALIA